MKEKYYDIGIIGLGVMGSNLALNMVDKGFKVAGLDKDLNKVQALQKQGSSESIFSTSDVLNFIKSLKTPRIVLFLVPAGAPVDAVINELLAHLSSEDILIDGGNSHFTDTDRRQKALAEKQIDFLGMGISGGEEGARTGPCLMPGGRQEAYERVNKILEKTAAQVQGEACIAYMGKGSAGHYVKMVHNGIEYGLMQLIAESYDLMKRGLGFNNDQLHKQFKAWNETPELNSFLIEITANIFLEKDTQSQQRLIDLIRDEAKQKGTGTWTSEDAFKMQVSIPIINTAVEQRDLSANKKLREAASKCLKDGAKRAEIPNNFTQQLKNALYMAMILTYTQGFALLAQASKTYQYDLNLYKIARIWRGGCIIRSAMLEHISSAFQKQGNLPLLFLDKNFANILSVTQADLRAVVQIAIQLGLPVPGLMATLSYYDVCRSAWLPANLIQAQRDYFGAHTYERIDQPNAFHTNWGQNV